MGRAALAVQRKLDHDARYFAENCLRIIGPGGRLVPMEPKPGQKRLYEAMRKQQRAGKPVRIIVCKARQLGFSTACAGVVVQRATRRENHLALMVAHNGATAGTVHDIATLMYEHLPPELKPIKTSHRKSRDDKYLAFGRINSTIRTDSAKNPEGGRGFTYRTLHASELAYWPYPEKLTALLNAVPEEPDTVVIIESTAQGRNDFYQRWCDAVEGNSDYLPVFAPWFEERTYQRKFDTPEDKAEFKVGDGPWGEAEPELVQRFGLTKEQLLWRRRTIVERCESKIEVFCREFPATAEEAFMASGKHVFSVVLINRVAQRAAQAPEPSRGVLVQNGMEEKHTRGGKILLPVAAQFEATNDGPWLVFEEPEPDGQYVIGCDVAGGEEDTAGNRAWHAIEVVNHRTLQQAAEYRSRVDADLLATELLLAALLYNRPWLAVETTGGWGIPVVRKLWRAFGYSRLYFRTPIEVATDTEQDRLGWDTNRKTKPEMEAGMAELLREGTDGIRSRGLAQELSTYVRVNAAGKSGPERGAFSDRLMAYMIAQAVAREKAINFHRGAQSYWQPRNAKVGW